MFPLPASALASIKEINATIAARQFPEREANYRDFAELNLRFHKSIFELTGNLELLRAYENLGYHQLVTRVASAQSLKDVNIIVEQHERIISALAGSSHGEAQRILSEHIASGRDRYVLEQDRLRVEA